MQRTFNKAERKPYFRNGSLGVNINAGELWTPSQITTGLWLDAADAGTITLSGSDITQWNDKSGNNRNATQSSAANRLKYGDFQLNGINVASIRGNRGMSVTYSVTTAYSIVLVCQHTLNGRVLNSTTVNALIAPSRTSNAVYVGSDVVSVGPVPSGTWSITTLVVPGTTTSQFWWAGTNYGSGTHGNWGNFHVGAFGGLFAEDPNGDVAEILVIPSALSTSGREIIEGYLAWKWGLVSTLPNDHPYKAAPPTL
jgi:hypothetical protein